MALDVVLAVASIFLDLLLPPVVKEESSHQRTGALAQYCSVADEVELQAPRQLF